MISFVSLAGFGRLHYNFQAGPKTWLQGKWGVVIRRYLHLCKKTFRKCIVIFIAEKADLISPG
tara:strand:- start:1 stop:189 length:189 start_codon:yes stop_codon:yes gene_type:complete